MGFEEEAKSRHWLDKFIRLVEKAVRTASSSLSNVGSQLNALMATHLVLSGVVFLKRLPPKWLPTKYSSSYLFGVDNLLV